MGYPGDASCLAGTAGPGARCGREEDKEEVPHGADAHLPFPKASPFLKPGVLLVSI